MTGTVWGEITARRSDEQPPDLGVCIGGFLADDPFRRPLSEIALGPHREFGQPEPPHAPLRAENV